MASTKNLICAGDLSHKHIGSNIRFRTHDERRDIVTVVTAELRQISSNQGHVTLYYGELAERDECFEPDHLIALMPEDDYSDVVNLLPGAVILE